MKVTPNNQWLRPLQCVLAGCVLLAGLSLGGCAGSGGVSQIEAQHDDIVTESDVTPQRKRARIRVELALDYFEQGKTIIALDEVKKALAVDPNYPDALSLRGLIYMRLDDFDIAEKSFARALALSPKNSDVLHNMGWLKCQTNKLAQAMDYFKRALADPLYGGRAKTYLAQGVCQSKAGQLKQAQASLTQAYSLDAGNPVVGYNLALVLFQRKDYLRARFYLNRINQGQWANAETLWLGIKVEKQLGNSEEMNQLAVALNRRFPDSEQAAAYQRGAFNE